MIPQSSLQRRWNGHETDRHSNSQHTEKIVCTLESQYTTLKSKESLVMSPQKSLGGYSIDIEISLLETYIPSFSTSSSAMKSPSCTSSFGPSSGSSFGMRKVLYSFQSGLSALMSTHHFFRLLTIGVFIPFVTISIMLKTTLGDDEGGD